MTLKILITGGCGFVGSWLSILLKKNHPDYIIYAFDNLKRRGSELNIPRLKSAGVNFVHGDVRIKEDLGEFSSLDTIIDASAEPSVLFGIEHGLDYLVGTNFNGTINCLQLAKKFNADFIFLSTSRVYPIHHLELIKTVEATTRFEISGEQTLPGIDGKGISESFPIDGSRSFYGASKYASELFVNEFSEFSSLKTVINRCGVIAGPWQMGKVDQGFVVLWAAKHYWKDKLAYIGYGGEGKQVRDILHIRDLYELIDYQIHNVDSVNGGTFNVGGGVQNSVSLLELTRICQEVTGNQIEIEKQPETRVADVKLYVTDNTKVSTETGWDPKVGISEIVGDIVQWIKENEGQLQSILR